MEVSEKTPKFGGVARRIQRGGYVKMTLFGTFGTIYPVKQRVFGEEVLKTPQIVSKSPTVSGIQVSDGGPFGDLVQI